MRWARHYTLMDGPKGTMGVKVHPCTYFATNRFGHGLTLPADEYGREGTTSAWMGFPGKPDALAGCTPPGSAQYVHVRFLHLTRKFASTPGARRGNQRWHNIRKRRRRDSAGVVERREALYRSETVSGDNCATAESASEPPWLLISHVAPSVASEAEYLESVGAPAIRMRMQRYCTVQAGAATTPRGCLCRASQAKRGADSGNSGPSSGRL